MVEKEPGDDRPSLEMPSLGFGRKRKKAAPPEPAPVAEPEQAAPPEPAASALPDAATRPLDPVPPAPTAPPLFVDETPTARTTAVVQAEHDEDHVSPAPTAKRRREFALPAIGGMTASIITGVVVGLLTVGATGHH